MSLATITTKGQTTIPKEIRDALGLHPQDQIQFILVDDGTVIMRSKHRSIKEMHGILHDPERQAVPLDDMKAWR
jgi:AbrB family looped-hinge helix DNA binding protein